LRELLKARHVDKARQHSSFPQTTICGFKYFAEFLKKFWQAIAWFTGGLNFSGEH
jgi:hypothetical protein